MCSLFPSIFSPSFVLSSSHCLYQSQAGLALTRHYINNLIVSGLANYTSKRIPVVFHPPSSIKTRHAEPAWIESRCPHCLAARYKCQHNPPIHTHRPERTSRWRLLLNPKRSRRRRLRQHPKGRCKCTGGRELVCQCLVLVKRCWFWLVFLHFGCPC